VGRWPEKGFCLLSASELGVVLLPRDLMVRERFAILPAQKKL